MPFTSVLFKTTLAERLSNAVADAAGDGVMLMLCGTDVGVVLMFCEADVDVVLILVCS